MQTRVMHPDGGDRMVTSTLADEEERRTMIASETGRGSSKHGRVPRWRRWIPQLVLFLGPAPLLFFFAGITNMDWQSPLSMNLAFAVALAAMMTVLSYSFLAWHP